MLTNAVDIKNVCVSYEKTQALREISFSIDTGAFLGIIGPNGGGKSTLLKAMLGFLTIDSGKICVFGNDYQKAGTIFGYVPQTSKIDRRFPISVFEVVLSGFVRGSAHPLFRYSKKQKEEALFLLEKTEIAYLKNRQICDLSGGEFQKMLIARAMASKPKLLLLDEPTANISPLARQKIYSLLQKLHSEMTIVLVTHDLSVVKTGITKLVCLNKTVVYDGIPVLSDEILNSV